MKRALFSYINHYSPKIDIIILNCMSYSLKCSLYNWIDNKFLFKPKPSTHPPNLVLELVRTFSNNFISLSYTSVKTITYFNKHSPAKIHYSPRIVEILHALNLQNERQGPTHWLLWIDTTELDKWMEPCLVTYAENRKLCILFNRHQRVCVLIGTNRVDYFVM
jgi:hypothetical protein